MMPRLSKIDKLIIAIGALLLIFLIVYAQFFSLASLKSDIGIKQQALKTEQKLLDMITRKKTITTAAEPVNTSELQKKVPVDPLQEQFILELEKAETVSKSEIKSMSFSKDAEVIPADSQTGTEITGNSQNTSQKQTQPAQSAENQANQTGSKQQDEQTPAGLKKLTVQLQVESPSYEDFEKFIDTLESLTRIVVVESINYSGGEEVTTLEQEDKPLSYTLTVSIFYMTGLTDLEGELPKLDAPAPAGKENPLSQFPSTAPAQP